MVTLNDFKKYIIKDTMSIKNSFMHYMKWIRVMLPVVFDEFEVTCIFLLSKNLLKSYPLPGFYGPACHVKAFFGACSTSNTTKFTVTKGWLVRSQQSCTNVNGYLIPFEFTRHDVS